MSDSNNSSIPAVENIGLIDENVNETPYECVICLETARNAVATQCGHLYCWPCLYKWMNCRPNNKVCPTCKSGILTDKIVPIYGSGGPTVQDSSDDVPPRPTARKIVPQQGNPNMIQENEQNRLFAYTNIQMKIISIIFYCIVNCILAIILSMPVTLDASVILQTFLNCLLGYVSLFCNIFF